MTVKKTAAHRGHAKKVPTLSRLRDIGRAVSSSDEDIRGRMVKDKNGQDLGRIEDLLVDDVKWKVRFMEVASGGILGFGDSKSFIPVDAITRMTADNVYISHTLEHVAGAPRYDPTLVAIDVNYLMELYPYYGYPGSFGLLP
jgi:sporulation protein YlmC with PRC-barrel domain